MKASMFTGELFSMTDLIMIAAIFLGPIFAVQLTRWLDDRQEGRERKLNIYRTLMATRAANLSPLHVEALNMIDIEFVAKGRKEKEVRDAWKMYLDHLNNPHLSAEQWGLKRSELMIDLLHKMGRSLNYDFDKVHIGKVYSPRAHGEIEDDQAAIRRGVRQILERQISIPVELVSSAQSVEEP
jgi:hypothetical protein